jgi:UPF0271 protein
MQRVDLNCDMGEYDDAEHVALEDRLMTLVSSVNISCGVHAGTPAGIRRTLDAAAACGLTVGAHPGYGDRAGFGRRAVVIPVPEIESIVADQVRRLAAWAAAAGVSVRHVKPHGVLYNQAARNREVADAVVRAAAACDPHLIVFGLANSALIAAARAAGLRVAEEAFIDRAYEPDATLRPRHQPGALLTDEGAVISRLRRLMQHQEVEAHEGTRLSVHADTVCLHLDTPNAVQLAVAVRRELDQLGVHVRPFTGIGV